MILVRPTDKATDKQNAGGREQNDAKASTKGDQVRTNQATSITPVTMLTISLAFHRSPDPVRLFSSPPRPPSPGRAIPPGRPTSPPVDSAFVPTTNRFPSSFPADINNEGDLSGAADGEKSQASDKFSADGAAGATSAASDVKSQ